MKFQAPHICSQLQKVPPVFFIFRYLNLPPGILSCSCILEFIRILRVTSPLLIVFAGREGRYWILTTLQFILGLLPHPIQWEWGNIGVAYKLLGNCGYSHHLSSTEPRPISVHLFYRGFCLALFSARLGMTLDSGWGCLSSHDVMNSSLQLLGIKNTTPASTDENVYSSHRISRNSPNTENSSKSTIPLGAQARWRVLRSPTRDHMCYKCFCSTLAPCYPSLLIIKLSGNVDDR